MVVVMVHNFTILIYPACPPCSIPSHSPYTSLLFKAFPFHPPFFHLCSCRFPFSSLPVPSPSLSWSRASMVCGLCYFIPGQQTPGRQNTAYVVHVHTHTHTCTHTHTQFNGPFSRTNHANTPPLSFLQAGCPSCHPTNSVTALKAYIVCTTSIKMSCTQLRHDVCVQPSHCMLSCTIMQLPVQIRHGNKATTH